MNNLRDAAPAIIVPYRDRAVHLNVFIKAIERRLPKSKIFIIEQEPGKPFNRGKLLNVGFSISEKENFESYCFHDVDMIPMTVDYTKPSNPTLIATKVSQFNFKLPFSEYFGGVLLFNKEDYIKADGHSNEFWGWGGEDNEMYDQVVKRKGMKVDYRDCFFTSLHHQRRREEELYKKNLSLWKSGRAPGDGLSNLDYWILSEKKIFTQAKIIKVSI